jgi:hypothetical protein
MPYALPANAQPTLAPYSQFKRASTQEKVHKRRGGQKTMLENETEEGLVVRVEPLEWAEEVSHTMVEVERLEDGALPLDVDPAWAGAINAVLVSKGVRVSELMASSSRYSDVSSLTRRGDWR